MKSPTRRRVCQSGMCDTSNTTRRPSSDIVAVTICTESKIHRPRTTIKASSRVSATLSPMAVARVPRADSEPDLAMFAMVRLTANV
jgi:hypothetical protein